MATVKRPAPIEHPVDGNPDLDEWRAEFKKWQAAQKAPVKPGVILAIVAWSLFFLLGLGMALGKIDATWFGVTFVAVCLAVGANASLAIYGSKKP
jgi:hypothetical protein